MVSETAVKIYKSSLNPTFEVHESSTTDASNVTTKQYHLAMARGNGITIDVYGPFTFTEFSGLKELLNHLTP